MGQPKLSSRADAFALMQNIPTKVAIIGTNRSVKIRGIHPYTIERLTKLWLERDMAQAESSADVLKSLCIEPYFAIKEACILSLNKRWKLILLYPFVWRIWAYIHEYTDEQMEPIILEGKKKLPLTAHWRIMAFSVDMRTDWMKMMNKEAEQYRAELLLALNQPLSKSSQSTESADLG